MRRGQMAMEFLMTYGWAILALVAAIGAFWYFGIFEPDGGPDACIIGDGIGCDQLYIDSTQTTFRLYNGAMRDYTDVNVSVECAGHPPYEKLFGVSPLGAGVPLEPKVWKAGEYITYDGLPAFSVGDKQIDCRLWVSYRQDVQGSYMKKTEGQIKYRKVTS
ncbi:MAG: hypothetical protein ABIH41_01990 [Nanoarchaeota archaeon]